MSRLTVCLASFLSAIAYLQLREISYESHVVVMLAVMESPAILVALLLGIVAGVGVVFGVRAVLSARAAPAPA